MDATEAKCYLCLIALCCGPTLQDSADFLRSLGNLLRVPVTEQASSITMMSAVAQSSNPLASAEELGAQPEESEDENPRRGGMFEEERVFVLTLGDKLKRLFDHDFPGVQGVRIHPVWVAGEVLEFQGDFNKYITSKGLQKQEGMIFRHLLRMILLLGEFLDLNPPDTDLLEWQADIGSIRERLTQCCRNVDPTSTDKMLGEN